MAPPGRCDVHPAGALRRRQLRELSPPYRDRYRIRIAQTGGCAPGTALNVNALITDAPVPVAKAEAICVIVGNRVEVCIAFDGGGVRWNRSNDQEKSDDHESLHSISSFSGPYALHNSPCTPRRGLTVS